VWRATQASNIVSQSRIDGFWRRAFKKDVLISQGERKLVLEKNAHWRIYNLGGSTDIIMVIRSRWIIKARCEMNVYELRNAHKIWVGLGVG
jgi:hypothetical protein